MNITSDDPRLTAYVLDELDRDGRNFIKNEMERHNECRFEARELAAFTDQLRAALATEPMPELAAKQERAIAARLQQTGARRKPFWVPIAANWLLKTELTVLAVVVLLCIPLPASLSTPVAESFENASQHTTRVLLQAVGTRVEWQGSSLVLPGPSRPFRPFPSGPPITSRVIINIECNRPIWWITILLAAGLLAGNLYLRSPRRILLLAAVVIPLVILSDGLRKFAMAEWLVHTSAGAMDSPVFPVAQSLFLLFPLLALIPFLIWFRRSERKRL